MFLSPRFAGQIRERLVSDAQVFQQMVVGEGAKPLDRISVLSSR